MKRMPRAIQGQIRNEAPAHLGRPALPIPGRCDVQAFTTSEAMERWSDEAAGLRPSNLAIGDNVITIFGTIGEDFWSEDGGITAKKIASQLNAIGERAIEVQINSPGGNVFEGIAIYNLLREHPAPITVKVIGMAASAASVIAMAGDEILIGSASFLMIHNVWVMAVGNRHDMIETANFLEPFDRALADLYAQRSGQEQKQISKWLDAETYMSGAEAIERGFADQLLPSDQVALDEKAKISDKSTNDVRALELSLVKAGLTRSQARERIKNIKGPTPGAEPHGAAPTPGAGASFMEAAAGLLATLKGNTNA